MKIDMKFICSGMDLIKSGQTEIARRSANYIEHQFFSLSDFSVIIDFNLYYLMDSET